MLTVHNLRKHFGPLTVIESLHFQMGADEFVAVIGPSGSGKTTFLNLIAGLTRPDGGSIDHGQARVGYVFQEDRLFPWLTVADNIRAVSPASDPAEIARLLDMVGLGGFGDYYPDELSGGMRQRAAIARAYNFHCDILLMDEPFSSLDYILRQEMLQTLSSIRHQRRTAVLFVTHHVADALAIASRIVVFSSTPAHIVAQYDLGQTNRLRDLASPQLVTIQEEINALLSL